MHIVYGGYSVRVIISLFYLELHYPESAMRNEWPVCYVEMNGSFKIRWQFSTIFIDLLAFQHVTNIEANFRDSADPNKTDYYRVRK